MELNERQRQMLDIVNREKYVTVQDLCNQLYSSPATTRRDLNILEKNRSVQRVCGGAIPIYGNGQEVPYDVRVYHNNAEKRKIAQTAAKLINEASTLIIDSSTTCTYLVHQLSSFKNLTVLTNGAESLVQLIHMSNITTIATGGIVTSSYEFRGAITRNSIERYNAELFFLSCSSISVENGVTFTNEENASIKQLMAKHAQRKILLCDSSKFDISHFCRAFAFSDFDYVITDTVPKNPKLRDAIGPRLICADDTHVIND